MSVQRDLLLKLAETMSVQLRKNIEPMKASGRTADSITAKATDDTAEVWALENIGALEYGRKPTSSGATTGNPTLLEQIKEWMTYKTAFSSLQGKEKDSVAYAITKKIHSKGTMLYNGKDFYGNSKPTGVISSVLEDLNYDQLLRDVTAYYGVVFTSDILKEIKQLE